MKFTLFTFLAMLAIMIFANAAYSQQYEDVVYLKSGSIIRGTIIEQVPSVSLKIKTKDGSVFNYTMEEVEKITKEKVEGYVNEDEQTVTQEKSKKLGSFGFRKGKSYINLMAGYAWGIAFGGGYEYAISDMIGAGVDLSYSSYDAGSFPLFNGTDYTTYSETLHLIGGLASVSFHFMPGQKFDPFIKAGIGYFSWSVSWSPSDPTGFGSALSAAQTSGVGYAGQVGFNYFMSPSFGLRLQAGYPFYASGGVVLKF